MLASIFCRTRGLDLCGLNIEPSNYCAVPAEVPWSQDRKLERSPTKFNIYGMIDLAKNISSLLWMQLFKLVVRRNLPPFSLIFKTKHPRYYKRLQNFHQSYVLLTDRIEIHQLQLQVWPCNLLYVILSGCDWWISIRSVNRRMRLARHIGFVIHFKVAQTYILRYYSTYCKTNGKEK